MLRRLPTSDFAPHVFDEGQELPFSLPDRPEEGRLEESRFEQNQKSVPITVEVPASVPQAPEQTLPASAPEPIAPQPSAKSPIIPARLPTIPEETALETEPAIEPPTPKRRGRPLGSKNKPRVCPCCTASSKCVAHCKNCKSGLACNQHTLQDRCAKCTRTLPCAAHR